MYDLEIAIPICTIKEKYARRLADFLRYGLINVGNRKVLLSMVGSEEDYSNLSTPDQISNIDVRRIVTKTGHVASKTYEYYVQLAEDFSEARWFMRVDDDSITDISRLCGILDKEFSFQKDWYLAATLNSNMERAERDILFDMGYGRWVKTPKAGIYHEWGACVLSRKSMQTILENPLSLNLIRKRSFKEMGSNDVCLGCAAKMCDIHAVDAYFLSKHPFISHFSLFGGNLAHVHFLSHDQNAHFFNLIVDQIEGKDKPDDPVYQMVVDSQFEFHKEHKDNTHFVCSLDFRRDGMIKGNLHGNEAVWTVQDGKLAVYAENGHLTTLYDVIDANHLKGVYARNPSFTHYLRRTGRKNSVLIL